ncbi:MAG: hypothetical protein AAF363_00380 [Bacteroidota bacterium]
MMFKVIKVAVFLLAIHLVSCTSSDKKIVTQEVLDELASREIKKVTDPQLFTSGFRMAQEIRDSLMKSSEIISNENLIRDGVIFELLSLDATEVIENEKKRTIVESYQYSLKEKLPIGDNISDFNSEKLIYSDLILDDETCRQLGSPEGVEECVLLLLIEKKIVVETLDNG